MRKLATIREIKEVVPIEGADFVELAYVGGWQCVVKKGEFRVGDKGVFFEIDSFLPVEPRYEFLRKGCYKKLSDNTEGFYIRTQKLRSVLSQGLTMPLSEFPELNGDTNIGDDVTGLLRIIKYEKPIPENLIGVIKGIFPTNIKRTEQERIQNLWDTYSERYKDTVFEVSLKLDGASMSVYFNNGDFGVCSKEIDLKEDDKNIQWQVVSQLHLKEVLGFYGRNIAIQGELIGLGIEGNDEKLKTQEFYIFDIWDIDKQRHLSPAVRRVVLRDLNGILSKLILDNCILAEEGLSIKHAPAIEFKRLGDFKSLDDLLEYTKGHSLNRNRKREGVVFKSSDHIYNEIISFKVLNNDYLLSRK